MNAIAMLVTAQTTTLSTWLKLFLRPPLRWASTKFAAASHAG